MRRASLAALSGLLLGAVLVPAVAASACADPSHAGGDWPIYGGDLHNTRSQDAETTIDAGNVGDLEPAWVFSIAAAGGVGTIESTPMVAQGCVYVATQAGTVVAINADDGALVWKAELEATVTTLAVADGRVFADVSFPDQPEMVALDADTGDVLWNTTLTTMPGSDVTGSPVAFGDLVATGTSCIGAEGSSGAARLGCRGTFVILEQATGQIRSIGYGIPDEDFTEGYAGGSMWSAPAIDGRTGYAYMGAGNPFSAREHPRTNALMKIDIDENRPTFGQVVDSYKATGEQYLPLLGTYKPLCEASGSNVGACEFPDLDMAMAPNIVTDAHGLQMVGDGQSSGIYHMVRSDTMEYVWSTVTGPPFAGARSGGAAYDGERIYTAGGVPGTLWGLDKNDGDPDWVAPALSPNVFNNVAHANGLVFSPSGGSVILSGVPLGVLLAYDVDTGEVVGSHPFLTSTGLPLYSTQAGGVSIARNTIYTPANGVDGGYVIAYRQASA